MDGSLLASSRAATSARYTSPLSAFFLSGRASVIASKPELRSVRTCVDVFIAPTLAANGILHHCVPGPAADASAEAAALTSCRRPHAMQEPTMTTLAGKTLFITGGSRGIGLAIAVRAARDGANV